MMGLDYELMTTIKLTSFQEFALFFSFCSENIRSALEEFKYMVKMVTFIYARCSELELYL